MNLRREIKVKGRVQGVGFRYHTRQKAIELELSGWVKNLPSGDVLIQTKGSKEHLESFINWCQKGPVLSNVTNLKIKEIKELVPDFSDFRIIRD